MVASRTMEAAVAGAIAVFGGIVALGAVGHGIGWDDAGPGAGYFPFRIGLLIALVGTLMAGRAVRWGEPRPFLSGQALRRVLALFVPTALCAALMPWLGCYLPSALFIAYAMRRLGGYGLVRGLLTGVAVMAAVFVLFEFGFQVTLAKGPLEELLGLD